MRQRTRKNYNPCSISEDLDHPAHVQSDQSPHRSCELSKAGINKTGILISSQAAHTSLVGFFRVPSHIS